MWGSSLGRPPGETRRGWEGVRGGEPGGVVPGVLRDRVILALVAPSGSTGRALEWWGTRWLRRRG